MNDNTKDDHNRMENQKQYNNILQYYVKNSKCAGKIKNILKIIFFCIILAIMVSFVVLFWIILIKYIPVIINLVNNQNIKLEAIIESLAGIFASLSAVVVSIMKLPEIIAKYLFDPEEDKGMISIVKDIQTYDTNMFFLRTHKNDELMKEKDKPSSKEIIACENNDLKIPESKKLKKSI